MRIASAIVLTDEERVSLTKWSRGRSTPTRLVLRAKIVLAAAGGRESKEIAAMLDCTRRTVGTWRTRFAESRLAGIEQDAPRGGRTPTRGRFVRGRDHPQDAQERHPMPRSGRHGHWPRRWVQRYDGPALLARQRPAAAPHKIIQGLERSAVR